MNTGLPLATARNCFEVRTAVDAFDQDDVALVGSSSSESTILTLMLA